MYAEGKYSVLICLQGMDTSGKDSLIKEVFKNVNGNPFSESKEELVIRKIVQGNYEIPNHVSPLLKDFLKNVMMKDPLERYDLEQIKAKES